MGSSVASRNTRGFCGITEVGKFLSFKKMDDPASHSGSLPCPSSSRAVGLTPPLLGVHPCNQSTKKEFLFRNGHLQAPGKKPGDLCVLIEQSFTAAALQRASSPDKSQSRFPGRLPASWEPPPTVGCAGLGFGMRFLSRWQSVI